ncbi:MAG: biotin--[acetyl-CoA-carboxylase] ligase [Phaeovulum sp.]|uniref:biotin--[acetyl-CoA-carboxylase] ligase n=1 Tax=Phaeovulum sp. TaxID=2934796 RepID=UPI00273005F6|nr:biotin--[acetyl-CoA-carboxylase] ligase [Phaeovulum sp.]MDP2062700.1 biotin--[acetyl-CoA-carboxylase] ligase [Phaeovulum sp.]
MTWPEGVARHVLDAVESTMTAAAKLAEGAAPTWVMAHRQTAGRGRRGRDWRDPPGNFAATLSLRPGRGPAEAALYSFVAALALHEALATVAGPQARLAIKWPNDVLLNGGKVAGILLESHGAGQGIGQLLIGIGVNLVAVPDAGTLEPGAVPPVALAPETGARLLPEEFLTYLAAAFARWQAQFETWGFAPIRTAWLARAARLGQEVTARTGTETRTGTFDTIDARGAMVLRTAEGRVAIAAAEVFF